MDTRRLLFAATLVAATACTAPETWTERGPVAEGIDCNPIAEDWDCMMPYPSDFYRVKTEKTARLPGGYRIELPNEARPANRTAGDEPFDFFEMYPSDGFSVVPQIIVRLPAGTVIDTAASNVVFHTGDLGASLLASSPTLLIDAETGEAQPHFAEYDMRPANPDERTFVIRPVKRLENGRRYVVALHALKTTAGAALAAPANFAKIRDGRTDSPLLDRVRGYYDGRIFPVLEKFGVKKSELVLAWDFTTQTWENVSGDLLRARELTLQALEAQPPTVTVTRVTTPAEGEPLYEHVGRRIEGTIRVPLFTVVDEPDTQQEGDRDDNQPGALLFRDADGRVAQNGWTTTDFTITIPRSVFDGTKPRPARIIQYGHGFFGGREEIHGYPTRFANEIGAVILGVDWTGMKTEDAVYLMAALHGPIEKSMSFAERTHQGLMEFVALSHAVKTTLKELDELQLAGALVYDPEQLFYYGISQGHIMGTTFLALSPHIDRGALSVGGASFGFMMSRSRNFIAFLDPIEKTVGGSGEAMRVVALLQSAIDRVDPITYTPYVRTNTFPGSPAKRHILTQIGIGDAQVPNLASHMQARSWGIPHLQPAPAPIWGLETTTGPAESAYVEWDFGVRVSDDAVQVTDDNPVHEGVRRQQAAIDQLDRFLRPGGLVENHCLSRTDGAAAACLCAETAEHTCNPAVCDASENRCEENTLFKCSISRRQLTSTSCANGCNPDTLACVP